MAFGWMLDSLVETSINCRALCVQATKPLVILRICTGSSEPLVVYKDDSEIACNGSSIILAALLSGVNV